MINKAKEVIQKLEFGLFELFIGFFMVIGLIGYFGTLPADLDWIDHTVAFIMFSYFFYILDITSILFGKTSKIANLLLVISYFSFFFKDIISYTKANAFKFIFIKFIDYAYLFFNDNLALITLVTFYTGVVGIFIASTYITKKITISHPSFLYAVFKRSLNGNILKFVSIFISLLAFYYLIYNPILEWLEFVLDDPIVAIGIVYFTIKIAKHRNKFQEKHIISKIGDLVWGWYKKFISLFHYKKTLPLAVSGLLILHALSDLGVFAYSMIFLKENFYLGHLSNEHAPFLSLFLDDAKNVPDIIFIPLFLVYLLNAMSLLVFFLIPIIVWARIFSQKELHFKRIFLFFIYASAAAYILLPGYLIKPLDEDSITGVDIISISLLESKSILDNFFADKSAVVMAVSLASLIFGTIIYILSSNSKIKKELYALSIIGGMTFFAVYLYYFFSSLLLYLYNNILLTLFSVHFVIGIILAVFLLMSAVFYIGGYLMFLYEIVMEYHKRKWSEPVDDELVKAIQKIKVVENRMLKPKKSQYIGEVMKYMLVGLVSVVILIIGYKMINNLVERGCQTEISKFEIELRGMDKGLSYGARELQSYNVPCKADRIYFFDLSKKINTGIFNDTLLMKDSLEGRSGRNVFLLKDGEVKRSFYAGNLEILYPHYKCLRPEFNKIFFFAEGAGKSVKLENAVDQPDCTIIPVNVSKEKAENIIEEASFDAEIIENKENDKSRVEITQNNVRIQREIKPKLTTTDVVITITPKKGIKKFKYIESFPKACIDDLENKLETQIETAQFKVKVKSDPLIMWKFKNNLVAETTLSYTLKQRLDENCRSIIEGLGIGED